LADLAERMKALWRSGQDKYNSFFYCLNEVRGHVGDDALMEWCFENLKISITKINLARDLLRKIDAEKVKEDLRASNEAAKQKRREDRERSGGKRPQRTKPEPPKEGRAEPDALDALADAYKRAERLRDKGHDLWVKGSMTMAQSLAAARGQFLQDQH